MTTAPAPTLDRPSPPELPHGSPRLLAELALAGDGGRVGLGAHRAWYPVPTATRRGGEPRIVELARQMVRLAGLVPDRDVEIRFTGLRPGEKLFEELFHGREPPSPTAFPGLLMATPRTADPAIVGRAIDEIASACRGAQSRLALALLARMVPEFEHNADGTAASARA